MIPRIVNYCLACVLGFLIVVTLRVTLPTMLALDEQNWLFPLQLVVVNVLIALTSFIVLEVMLIYLSIAILYLTCEWVAVLYIPLLIYSLQRTYAICVGYLASIIKCREAKHILSHWQNYIEHGDEYWIELQARLGCCGLDGPRSYLNFYRRVPDVCYKQGVLVTRGCENVVYDICNPMRYLSEELSWLAVGLQVLMLVLYTGLVITKYVYLLRPGRRRGRRPNKRLIGEQKSH